jgi:hypothetical protein
MPEKIYLCYNETWRLDSSLDRENRNDTTWYCGEITKPRYYLDNNISTDEK